MEGIARGRLEAITTPWQVSYEGSPGAVRGTRRINVGQEVLGDTTCPGSPRVLQRLVFWELI